MRVAVQCWLLGQEPSGARRRLLGLLAGLTRIELPESLEVALLVDSAASFDLELERIASSTTQIEIHRVAIPHGPTTRRAFAERRLLPGLLRELGCDMLDIASLPVPRVEVPVTLTLHDLRDHGRFARPWRRWLAKPVLRDAVRRAAAVLVPSPDVARELEALHPEVADRLTVLPPGLDPRFLAVASRERRGFLHVGRPEARKNLDFLLAAYQRAATYDDSVGPLLLAGPGPRREWQRLREHASRGGITNRVETLGMVPEAELPDLYASVQALLFPSRLEGFGLPILEAMAAATPCLVAAGGACAWVAGGGGLALPATDVSTWATGILRVHTKPAFASGVGRIGRARAREFTRERATTAWVEAWYRAAGRSMMSAES